MKYKARDTFVTEPGEPALRSCWECNPAHDHLKDTDGYLHLCFACGRYWIDDRYLDSFTSDEEFDVFMREHLKPVEAV